MHPQRVRHVGQSRQQPHHAYAARLEPAPARRGGRPRGGRGGHVHHGQLRARADGGPVADGARAVATLAARGSGRGLTARAARQRRRPARHQAAHARGEAHRAGVALHARPAVPEGALRPPARRARRGLRGHRDRLEPGQPPRQPANRAQRADGAPGGRGRAPHPARAAPRAGPVSREAAARGGAGRSRSRPTTPTTSS